MTGSLRTPFKGNNLGMRPFPTDFLTKGLELREPATDLFSCGAMKPAKTQRRPKLNASVGALCTTCWRHRGETSDSCRKFILQGQNLYIFGRVCPLQAPSCALNIGGSRFIQSNVKGLPIFEQRTKVPICYIWLDGLFSQESD